VPAPAPPTKSIPVTAPLGKNDTYKGAVSRIFPGVERTPWVTDLDYEAARKSASTINADGQKFEVYHTCKPHDCGANQFFAFFTPGGREAYGIIIEDSIVGFYGSSQGQNVAAFKTYVRNELSRSTAPIPRGLN